MIARFFLQTILLIALSTFSALLWAEQSLTLLPNSQPAPAFTLLDMEGVSHQLSDYKGKPLIVNFWATWCPPCRAEIPSMERAWNTLKEQDIGLLAINVGEDEDTIFTFTADYPASFTLLLDQSGEIIKQWPIRGLPTTFVIDSEGKLVYRAIGGREWDDEALLDKVRALKVKK